MPQQVSGFSKLSKTEKINLAIEEETTKSLKPLHGNEKYTKAYIAR